MARLERDRGGAKPAAGWMLRTATAMILGACAGQLAAQTQGGTAARLQALSATQANALASGDSATILQSSRALAAFAEQLLGDLALEQRRPETAVPWYRQAYALVPEPEAGLELLAAELAAGKPVDAEQTAGELVRAVGDNARLRLTLANAFHSAGDVNGTIAQLTRAVALDPADSALHLALGNAFWELNESQYNADSLREFTEAARLAPADYFANYDLGAILSQYQRFGEAAEHLRQAAAADPASPDPWLQLGMNAYTEGRTAEAREALERAVSLTGADTARNGYAIRRADSVLSRIASESGQAAAAEERQAAAAQLREAMLRNGISTTLTESSGLVTSATPGGGPGGGTEAHGSGKGAADDKAPAAETAGQAAIARQLQAVAARSLNDAGTALARGHDYAGALPLFRQAAAADPTLVPVMRNLGLAAFHTGGFEEAAKALAQAVAQDPGDALAARYLEQARAGGTTQP